MMKRLGIALALLAAFALPAEAGFMFNAFRFGGAHIIFEDQQTSTTNATTYNFTANIGTTNGCKLIAIFGSRASGTPSSISSATINSTAAAVVTSASQANDAHIVAFWIASGVTGSASATVSVTFGQGQNRAAIGVFHIDNITTCTAGGRTDFWVSTASDPTGTLTVSAGGVVATACEINTTTTSTAVGFTERWDTQVESAQTFTGGDADDAAGHAADSLTTTCNYATGTSFPAGVGVSFR